MDRPTTLSRLGLFPMFVDVRPKGPPTGATLEAMIRDFEALRDREFASYDCSNHPKEGIDSYEHSSCG